MREAPGPVAQDGAGSVDGGPVGRGPEDEWQRSMAVAVVDEYGAIEI